MTGIYLIAIFSAIGLISLISVIRYFIKKQRAHKDFYIVVIICGFFSILTLYLVTTSVIDIVSYHLGKVHTAEGICEIYFFEADYRSPGRYDIWIDDLGLTADPEDFSYLKEEKTACKVTYLKATGTLIDIDLK
ncbi:hypothetical protein ACQKMN_03725 [Ureibacillus composti]